MSNREFLRWLLFDVAAFSLLFAAVIGVVLIGPAWTAGAIAFIGVPVAVVGVVAWVVWSTHHAESRRRDELQANPGADHAHQTPPSSAASKPGASGPTHVLSSEGRPARADVCTAWTDSAWATHWTRLHTYRSTRPGR